MPALPLILAAAAILAGVGTLVVVVERVIFGRALIRAVREIREMAPPCGAQLDVAEKELAVMIAHCHERVSAAIDESAEEVRLIRTVREAISEAAGIPVPRHALREEVR